MILRSLFMVEKVQRLNNDKIVILKIMHNAFFYQFIFLLFYKSCYLYIMSEEAEALAHVRYVNLRKKVNAEGWSDNMELLLKRWAEKAAGLRFLHSFTGGEWKKFADYSSLAAILVTILASGASLGAASVDDQDVKDSILISVGGIGLISSLIQSLKQFYNAEEKTADHLSLAKQFGSFYRYITLQLAMSREERDPSDVLTAYSLKEYERLMSEAPTISGTAIKAFKEKFKNSEQTSPDIAQDSFVVEICKEITADVEKKQEDESKNSAVDNL